MLKHLYVKDFIIIDEIDLTFDSGFSVFTGETGAGKSILIDAIGLLCGQRAGSDCIRTGKQKALIEGVFQFAPTSKSAQILIEAGYDCNEDIFITREITSEGSTVRINHRLTTLGLVKECLAYFVDIHSQHDSQYLLNTKYHLQLLDQFINEPHDLKQLKALYQSYAQSLNAYTTAVNETYNLDDLTFLEYEINEIQNADIHINEDEELELKIKQASAYEKIASSVNATLETLVDQGAIQGIYEAHKYLSPIHEDEVIEGIKEHLLESYYAIDDLASQLKDHFEGMEFNEAELNSMQQRLFDLNKLKRKYGHNLQAVLDHMDENEQRIHAINNRTEHLEKLEKQRDEDFAHFNHYANKMSELRKIRAKNLEKQIETHLKDLQLPNARFEIAFQSISACASGTDGIEFLISMNQGEILRPLIKVASGGELSRLMLGLKAIFTQLQGISLVIFDEIDTGVSGSIASAIGHKMFSLAKDAQVFSVTHLAQVASCANFHYHVSKNQEAEHTTTAITLLDKESSIEQLALIASGTNSESAIKAARELYESNQKIITKLAKEVY